MRGQGVDKYEALAMRRGSPDPEIAGQEPEQARLVNPWNQTLRPCLAVGSVDPRGKTSRIGNGRACGVRRSRTSVAII